MKNEWLYPYIRILRLYNSRVMVLFYLIGRGTMGTFVFDRDIIIVPALLILTYATASIYNYLADIQIDRLNRRNNPIGDKTISEKTANYILRSLIIGSLLLSLLAINVLVVLVGISALYTMLYLYSSSRFNLGRRPWSKIILMGLGYTLVPALIGLYSISPISKTQLVTLLLISIFYTSWLPYTDVKDIAGDIKYGKRTLVNVYGLQHVAIGTLIIGFITGSMLTLSNSIGIFSSALLSMLIILQGVIVVKPQTVANKLFVRASGYLLLAGLLLVLFGL